MTFLIESGKEEVFKSFFENSVVGMSMTSLDGRMLINNAFCDMLGYSQAEMAGIKWMDITYPDDLAQNFLELESILNGERSFSRWQKRYFHKNKSIVWVDISTAIQRDPDGNPQYFITTVTNITEQIKLRDSVAESEERYRLLMKTLPDSVIVHSQGKIVYANPASAKAIGAANSMELIGMDAIQMVHPDYREMAIQRIVKAVKGTPVPQIEEKLVRLDGTVIDVEISAVPISYSGKPAMLTVINDITTRKRAELLLQEKTELIQAQNEEYQQINEELTQTNEALIQAKAKAEESDRLKSAFLANMSHEIRTPLNSIIGFSDLLCEEENDPVQVIKYSSVIKASGNRLLQLISNLIDISKIESGTEPVTFSQVSAIQTIQEVISQFRLIADEKSIELTMQHSSDMEGLCLYTDSLKLHQILSNLVGNAVKFNKDGIIRVGIERHPDGVLFFVSDTGIGIPLHNLPKVFDRFYQVDTSISRRSNGAGLGLSLCKGMVELLGGKIWVESEIGKGSTFSFILPA